MSFIFSVIGAGVVGATTSLMLYLVNKNNIIVIFEMNNKVAFENSRVINNAGTGHAGMCENNYILKKNNDFFIRKNINIYFKFELTKIFFSWLLFLKIFKKKDFLSKTSHVSFFYLKKNKKMFKIIRKIRFFNKLIKFSFNSFKTRKIFPLLFKKRKIKKNFSISYYKKGFDINYELLSKRILNFLSKKKNIYLYTKCKVLRIKKIKKNYSIKIKKKIEMKIFSNYVFICSGGNSLSLIQQYNNELSKKYMELPVDGKWLILENKNKIIKHNIKVYSETLKINPPMSVPHLDIRLILKEKKIFFGPFAGLTFNLLMNEKKNIFYNINLKIILNLVKFVYKNNIIMDYLIKENIKSKKKKIENLYSFLKIKKIYSKKAGKRLQIVKIKKKNLKLIFGTKLIFDKSKKLVVLLGASPGASISVYISKKIINNWINFSKFLINKKSKKMKIFHSILYYT